MDFSKKLITWYLDNKRDLPWRKTKNPYFVWLSEIILQQTRIAQGLSYYLKFAENFPTIFDLPITTAFLPAKLILSSLRSNRQP